jgi:putative ABC transport system permease protein
MLLELKYAWRMLRKNWGYTLLCATAVALSAGLGGWASVVVYAQFFRALPFPGAERWYSVQIATDAVTSANPTVDAYTYQELLKRNRSADHLGAYQNRAAVLSEGQASTTLRAAAITPRLLAATQVAPHLGRVFADADRQPGAAPSAVLSFDTWQSYFASDPAIIGKTARIDAAPVRIIGVMPKDFFVFQDSEIWFPLELPQVATPRASTMSVTPFIVLGKNQTLDSLRTEMNAIVTAVNRDDAELYNPARNLQLIPTIRMFSHPQRPVALLLVFLAGAVLLLGGMNISMMFLARLLERSRELAVRSALGASRARLLRQCLLESALILPLALLAGYGIAVLLFSWINGLYRYTAQVMAQGRPTMASMRPIDVVIGFVIAIVIWLLSTLIPAWRIARQDVALVIAGSGKGTSASGRNRSSKFLVGLEVIVSSLVLVVAWGMVVAVKLELNKQTGLNTANVMMTTYATTFGDRYSEPANRLRYWDDLGAAIASKIPGAEVAFATAPPSVPARVAATIETQQGADRQGTLRLRTTTVSEGYFKMLGMSLRSGRLFDTTDNRDSLPVAIVDEQMAARYWPGQDALGKRIQLKRGETDTWLTVVGVVSTVRSEPYVRDNGIVYQPLRQVAPSAFRVLLRSRGAAADSRTALQAAAFGVDRDVPLRNLQPLDDYLAAVNLGFTAIVPAFIVVSALTALLAASGVFGLISRTVVQRTQEVGIRRALGATPWRATSRFMRQGAIYLAVSVVGVALGLMVTNGISATITNILDSVLLVTLGVVLLLSAVIFAASYLPSRRALALEPGEALRYE